MMLVKEQLMWIGGGIFCGILLGFFYDIYRQCNKKARQKPILMMVLDLLWWLIVFLILFFLWLVFTWGEVRGLLFCCQALGFVLYHLLLSPHLLKLHLPFSWAVTGRKYPLISFVGSLISYLFLLVSYGLYFMAHSFFVCCQQIIIFFNHLRCKIFPSATKKD